MHPSPKETGLIQQCYASSWETNVITIKVSLGSQTLAVCDKGDVYGDTHYPYQVYFPQIGNARHRVIHLPIHSASPDDRWVVIPFRHRYLYWWGDKKIEIAPLSKSVVLLRWSHFSWCTNLVMMCLAYYMKTVGPQYVCASHKFHGRGEQLFLCHFSSPSLDLLWFKWLTQILVLTCSFHICSISGQLTMIHFMMSIHVYNFT